MSFHRVHEAAAQTNTIFIKSLKPSTAHWREKKNLVAAPNHVVWVLSLQVPYCEHNVFSNGEDWKEEHPTLPSIGRIGIGPAILVTIV